MEAQNTDLSVFLMKNGKLPTPEEASDFQAKVEARQPDDNPITAPGIDEQIAADENKAEAPAQPTTYTVRGLMSVARAKVEPLDFLWNGMPLLKNGIAEIIGPPGIGKSRFVSSLARAQILGRQFGGLDTLSKPKCWLFVGSENDINRLHNEAQKFLLGRHLGDISGWTDEQFYAAAAKNGLREQDVKLLEECFHTFTLEKPEDCLIALNDENIPKLVATLKEHKPDIIIFDPWGDLIAGDELCDADIRETIKLLRKCIAEAGLQSLSIIVNHARIGLHEMINAYGPNAGNYGKNSKCLYSVARYVLNIRQASLSDTSMVEVICAKNNNGPLAPRIAFKLDAESAMYEHIADFDHDAWQQSLESNNRARNSHSSKSAPASIDYKAAAKKAMELLQAHPEAVAVNPFIGELRTTLPDVTRTMAAHVIDFMMGKVKGSQGMPAELGLETYAPGFPKSVYIGTHEQIEAKKAEDARKKAERTSKKIKKTNETPVEVSPVSQTTETETGKVEN